MTIRRAAAVALFASSISLPARAADVASAHNEPEPSPGMRALAAGAAIVPGAVVHGTGSLVAGKKKTATKLGIVGGMSLASSIGAIGLIAFTGASRRVVGPLAAIAVGSVGIFATSFVADLYAVLAPDGGVGEPFRVAPRYETRLGVLGVYDPVFSHGLLVDERIDARLGWLRVSAAAQFAPESTTRRLRAELAARLVGPKPSPSHPALDGSFVDLEAAATDHAYARGGFGTTLGEVSLRARYDLARFDHALSGSFTEGQIGSALFRDRYETGASDVGDLLIARFAWGMYLGHPEAGFGRPAGEASLFYEHRRDGWAGGLQPTGIPSGYLGSFGATARMYVHGPWGVGADVQAGSALLAGISILFRPEAAQ